MGLLCSGCEERTMLAKNLPSQPRPETRPFSVFACLLASLVRDINYLLFTLTHTYIR